MVFYCEDSETNNERNCNQYIEDLLNSKMLHDGIYNPSCDTGKRINFLSKNQRDVIANNIPYHSTEYGRNHSHHDGDNWMYTKVKDFCRPSTVKTAIPTVSKMKKVLRSFITVLPKKKEIINPEPIMMRYMVSFIQPTGVLPRSKSLTVPPPIAVMNPTAAMPNISSFLSRPASAPLMAKTIVPTISMK